jgi:hypothetical protein
MNENETIKVIELRNYLIKPNLRDRFVNYFGKHFVESQNVLGGFVLGAFRIKHESDRFFWIRGFSDMTSRSRFLPEFYYGDVWKKYGGEANEMMIDSDNVYLLKPVNHEQIFRKNKLMTIDFYFAADGKLDELITAFQTNFVPNFKESAGANLTLWQSELSENDFPRLPAFQYENLLVTIAGFDDETVRQTQKKEFEANQRQLIYDLENLVIKKESLIIQSIEENEN